MPILATVILDSGFFLPVPESNGTYTKIGYFGSDENVPDICVKADGLDVSCSEPMNLGCPESNKLGKECEIEIRHVKADGSVNKDGVLGAKGFQEKLLHLSDLYDTDDFPAIDSTKFDCIIRFDSGRFCPALVKPRDFKKYSMDATTGKLAASYIEKKTVHKPIPHNIQVHFTLEDGETIQFARDGKVFWSSKDSGAKQRLDIDIIADNSTAEKFYCAALKCKGGNYWLPNQGDPPPICSQPPCEPRKTFV